VRTRWGLAHVAAGVTAAAFALWTWLVLGTDVFAAIDATSQRPGLDPMGARGQVLAAIAVVTTPVVVYATLAGVTSWAARRRLHNLAWAMGLSIPLAWGGGQLVKVLVQRPRPPTAAPLITAEGWSYPSAHMVAVTVLAVMMIAAMVVTRRPRGTVVLVTTGLLALWWIVFADRWWLRAHWFSDLIGGGFLGGFVAALSLAVGGVSVVRFGPVRRPASGRPRHAAVIINPTKIADMVVFRRQVEGECTERGWEPPVWLETEVADAGARVAKVARKRKVDLVLVAGGDGTVRTVCAALAESGIPVGILPLGTGNLLARNLGVPLDLADALDTSFDGNAQPVDIVQLRADGGDPQYSMVMAGMGLDAKIMSETNLDLKKVVGPAAYFMAGLATLNTPPFRAMVTLDGNAPIARTPAVALIANVGHVQGQIAIVPDALPDDGLVDVMLASPERVGDWGAIATRVLTRAADHPGVERAQARKVAIETEEPVPFQVDGDTIGTCTRLDVTVRPQAIQVMVP